MYDLEEVVVVGFDIHETVGAGVVVAAHALLLEFLPRGLRDHDVVKLEPHVVLRTVHVGPVVARGRLTLVDQDRMETVRMLQVNKEKLIIL